MSLNKLLIPLRLVYTVRNVIFDSLHVLKQPKHIVQTFYMTDRIMAQRSITSFFKISPPKNAVVNKKEDHSMSKENGDKSPSINGVEKKLSKRPRLESSGSETEVSKSPKITSEKKKKAKRQRIESTDSESDSVKSDRQQKSPSPEQPIKDETIDSPTKTEIDETNLKVEKQNKPKTYDSPKNKKRKLNTLTSTNNVESPKDKKATKTVSVKEESKIDSPKVKELKTTASVKKDSNIKSPKQKESKKTAPLMDKLMKNGSPKTTSSSKSKTEVKQEVVGNGTAESPEKTKEVGKVKQEVDKEDSGGLVPETEYNPAKSKYHPIKDACWSAGQPVPYLALARTLDAIEVTSARLKIIEILANYFRSVIALTPEDLLPSVYMCLNKLAPAYHSLELGIAETYLMKAVGQCTGRSISQVKAAAAKAGDLGLAAAAARATQRTMFTPAKLVARKVFAALKEIANMTGQASVNKKISKIQTLFVACRHSEAKFLIRSCEGKLRIGLAEQSVLQALAVAVTLTPPPLAGEEQILDASKGHSPDAFKSRVDANALIIKTTYCECPNYDLVIPALLRHGAAALPRHCRLTVGIPLKPMLAHPTKGVHEVFNRFEGSEFTCEWKYDGERAQIHVPGEDAPDLQNASIFSRNQENNTSKYPDVLGRLPSLLKPSVTSCVLDCEAVAYDLENKQILPFQILSTRKRKDASEADIKVQVCVFVFDLLFLNGKPLVREPLAQRRKLLRENFNEVEGSWQFATSRDCSSMEEVQQFLEESVKGSCEGLMVKTLDGDHAKYDIARRSHNWLKLKKDYLDGVGDTIDVVIIGAYRGRGKRHRTYGGFLAAARDTDSDTYQALCKLGTGFSDEDLQTLTEELDKHVIEAPRSYYSYDNSHSPDVWFDAVCVWEVRCADLSLSPSHRAAIGLVDPDKGISLRFPRFIRVREDKPAEAATSARQIADMYLAQDQVKNNTNKAKINYDDFY